MGGVHRGLERAFAELVIDGKPDGTGFGTDEETERLESLRKPFLSLLAKAQEESLNGDSRTEIV